jgi:hypothetical protein
MTPGVAGRTSAFGYESLSAHRTLDTLKVDAPHIGRRNQSSAFRAYRIERRPHLFQIDLSRAWRHLGILVPQVRRKKRGISSSGFMSVAITKPTKEIAQSNHSGSHAGTASLPHQKIARTRLGTRSGRASGARLENGRVIPHIPHGVRREPSNRP